MRLLFGVSLSFGVALLLAVLVLGAPKRARVPAAVTTAFGIAGLSAAYAGWPTLAALPVALVSAIGFGWFASTEGS